MNSLIDRIMTWIKSRNITSHAIAGLLTLFAGAYISDEQVRNGVLDLFKDHPKVVALISWVCLMWFKYSSARSAVGIMQEVPAAEAKLAAAKQEKSE